MAKATKGTGSKGTKKAASTKAKAKPSTNGHGESGVERSKDLPWNGKKVAVFKALKAFGCTSMDTARSAADLANKANVTNRDVRHYCYHAKAAGLVAVASNVEGISGYAFYLTTKGKAVDLQAIGKELAAKAKTAKKAKAAK